jgi:transcriptional regulator with XRE-family HTH domain
MNLGKVLQDLRKNKNISQEEMADTLNVSRQTISNWENSKSYPDIISLMKLCDIYKISLDDLFKDNQDLLDNIKKNENKKKKNIIICISIIILLILLLLYFVFFKDYFYNISSIKSEVQMIMNNKDSFVEIKKSKLYNKDEMTNNYIKITDSEYKYVTAFLDEYEYKYSSIYSLVDYYSESSDIMAYEPFSRIFKTIKFDTSPFIFGPNNLDIVIYDEFFKEKIIGNTPSKDNEIMISNVLANFMIANGIKTTNGNFYPRSYDDIINYKGYYYFDEYKIKISGIIDYDLSNFYSIKDLSWNDYNNNYELYHDIYDKYVLNLNSIYNKIYVNKDYISNFNKLNFETSDGIWQMLMVRTGLMVIENDKDKLFKLFKKFDTNPYFIKSSSTLFDKE